MGVDFSDPDLFDALEAADDASLDALPYGVVAMAFDGTVTSYNRAECLVSGLTSPSVIGHPFFTHVAPCTNNAVVAERFENEPDLDETIAYVFTFALRATAVRLRLLKGPGRRRMYLVVELRSP